ncbi:unnamed protein product [Rotaria sp. Silwood1]|nr:unnamed protein product [Rotaria sp. Silwood1]CAF5126152.1 unnamed protein product [Rotaria sp. Silwood1]
MISIPVNINTVYIPIVRIGCFKAEFDSTYPIHLNGIISPHEFQESINKINLRLTSNKKLSTICSIMFALIFVFGLLSGVVGAIIHRKSYTAFGVLLVFGVFLMVFGGIIYVIGIFFIHPKRSAQLKQAIAEESMRYSSRSPTPCSWRIDTSRSRLEGHANHHNSKQILCQLAIDIDCSDQQENVNRIHYSNKAAPESTEFVPLEDSDAPPPYSV